MSDDLPVGWIVSTFGVLNLHKSKNIDPRKYPDETFELYSVPSFPSKKPEILKGSDIGSPKQYVAPGDVLVCKINPRINRVWVVGEKTKHQQIASSEWIIFRSPLLEPTFFLYQYSANNFRELICKDVTGVGGSLTRAQPKRVASFPVNLPPLNEQKRIAEKLDQLLTAVDAAKNRLDKVPTILKRFRQSVLAAAVSGELTKDWRKENLCSSNDIPSLLAKERQKKWTGRGKYKPAILADQVESVEFTDIPSSWYRGTLNQITWSVKDGPHFSPKYSLSGVPFISGGSIKPGKIDLSIAKFISQDLHEEFSVRCKPEYLDILYTKGGTTGLAAVNTLRVDFNVWVHVAVLKLLSPDLINPFYIQHALNSPECYQQSQRYTHGVGNQDLGLTRMIKIVIPIPPIEEQREIVRRVETLFTQVERMESIFNTAHSKVELLPAAILTKAFCGELVPQDPNDEPAEVLLQRIANEKKEQKAGKPVKRRKKSMASKAKKNRSPP